MAEYIDREALEVELNHRLAFLMAENGEYDHYTTGYDEAVCTVEDFQSVDAVKVVRCGDCRFWYEGVCSLLSSDTPCDWYCANGRRTDDE